MAVRTSRISLAEKAGITDGRGVRPRSSEGDGSQLPGSATPRVHSQDLSLPGLPLPGSAWEWWTLRVVNHNRREICKNKTKQNKKAKKMCYPGRQFLSSSQRGPNPLYKLISVVNGDRRTADRHKVPRRMTKGSMSL